MKTLPIIFQSLLSCFGNRLNVMCVCAVCTVPINLSVYFSVGHLAVIVPSYPLYTIAQSYM